MYWGSYESTNLYLYKGYELDKSKYELSDYEIDVLDLALYIIDNRCSIRDCAKEFGVGKSSVHFKMRNVLPKLSFEIYRLVVKQLGKNKIKYFPTYRWCG